MSSRGSEGSRGNKRSRGNTGRSEDGSRWPLSAVLILTAGIALRFVALGQQSFWRDEIHSILRALGGEDGSLQGLLDVANIPYVGAGVLGSAACMDKLVSKRVLRDAGISVLPAVEAPSALLRRDPSLLIQRAERAFPYPVFVKPTCTGSSVGVSKAENAASLEAAIAQAAAFDTHVLVEPAVDAREIE